MFKPFTLRMPDHKLPAPPYWLKQKQSFHLDEFHTCSGEKIIDLNIGYECYGRLNDKRDNAILICHYFSGSSNAAGKYSLEDAEPGYWDLIIGPGKAIDTDRFFVLAVDTLCNLNIGDPRVISTGPTSLNPQTQKPYGMSFPLIDIKDFVEIQKAVAGFLKIEKFHAVAGPSLGAMQVMQWAASYPEMLERAIPVIGCGFHSPAYLNGIVDFWCAPILLDSNWNAGNYYANFFPAEGLKQALRMVTLNSLSPDWARSSSVRDIESSNKSFASKSELQTGLDEIASERMKFMDPNHFLYIVKAVQNFSVMNSIARMKSKFLFISAQSDLLMLPKYSEVAVYELRARGLKAEYFEIEGQGGHLDGIFAIDRADKVIRDFLQ